MAERKGDGVKVVDRRTAAQDAGVATPAPEPAPEASVADDEAAFAAARDRTCDEPVPPIDFVTFVLSLSTNTMVSLGILPAPGSQEKKLDLPLARQTIDLLAILQEKTKGNLTGEEERILDTVLYDLRMSYVQVVRERC
ncbi:MAG: DUF1844 domain-containing protein [Deltaproteobacteria bacterium]|nr:DUF1844 domain-containing protein [Deltaproteobacteria bacterium]